MMLHHPRKMQIKNISLLKDFESYKNIQTGRCSLLSRIFHIVIGSSSRGFPVSSNTQSSGTVDPRENLKTLKPGSHFRNLDHFFPEPPILDTCTLLYIVLFVHDASWFLRIDRSLLRLLSCDL